MPGHVFNDLSPAQRSNIKCFLLTCYEDELKFTVVRLIQENVTISKENLDIWYRDNEGSTNLDFARTRKVVEQNFVSVFCEDFNLLLSSSKSRIFAIRRYEQGNRIVLESIMDRVFACLEVSLKADPSTRLFHLVVEPLTLAPVMKAISHIQFQAISLEINFFKDACPINLESLLNYKNKGKLINLIIRFYEITLENIIMLNEMFPAFKERMDNYPLEVHFSTCKQEEEVNAWITESGKMNCVVDWDRKKVCYVSEYEKTMLTRRVFENGDIMKSVLENLKNVDIQRLRKVSRGTRKCVDDVQPNPHLTAYCIDVERSRIEVEISVKSSAKNEIVYYMFGGKCHFSKLRSSQTDMQSIVLQDFELNTAWQKERMKELRVYYQCFDDDLSEEMKIEGSRYMSKFCASLGEILKKRKGPLKVEMCGIATERQEDLMHVLPHIDPYSLYYIDVYGTGGNYGGELKVDEVSKTEQWKEARQLIISSRSLPSPVEDLNIAHFTTAVITLTSISSDDVSYLKTELLKSSNFKKFDIKFVTSTIDDNLHTLIGEPYRIIADVKKIWYFRMPYTEYYLRVVLDIREAQEDTADFANLRTIQFNRVEKGDTPFF